MILGHFRFFTPRQITAVETGLGPTARGCPRLWETRGEPQGPCGSGGQEVPHPAEAAVGGRRVWGCLGSLGGGRSHWPLSALLS